MMLRIFRRFYKFCNQVYEHFDGCFTSAAALSYTTLLSIVPLVAVSLSIFVAFPVFKEPGQRLQNLILDNFVATRADEIHRYLEQFTGKAMSLSATGLIFLLVTAILMIVNMESALNTIWGVKQRRKGISAIVIYWSVLTLLPILIAAGFAASQYFMQFLGIELTAESLANSLHLFTLLPYFVTCIAFLYIYMALPNTHVRFREAFVGSVIATILFNLAKFIFSIYVILFPTYELLYGALAVIPLFLVWIYVSWLIILLGAVISVVVGSNLGESKRERYGI